MLFVVGAVNSDNFIYFLVNIRFSKDFLREGAIAGGPCIKAEILFANASCEGLFREVGNVAIRRFSDA